MIHHLFEGRNATCLAHVGIPFMPLPSLFQKISTYPPGQPCMPFSEWFFPNARAIGGGHPQNTLPPIQTNLPVSFFSRPCLLSHLWWVRWVHYTQSKWAGPAGSLRQEGWWGDNLSVRPLWPAELSGSRQVTSPSSSSSSTIHRGGLTISKVFLALRLCP